MEKIHSSNSFVEMRARLIRALAFWALADVAGLLLIGIAGLYLIQGRSTLVDGFPSSTLQASIAVLAGLGVVAVAAVKMLTHVFHFRHAVRGLAANDPHHD